MKITNIKIETLKLELLKPLTVALGTIEHVETLLVQIETDEGITGIGEGSPFEFVTGETLETSIKLAKQFKDLLIGENPLQIEKIHTIMDKTIVGNTATKAAFDIALHDLMGKKMNAPLYQLLGGHSNSFMTDVTIGIDTPEIMAKEAKERVDSGFSILKVKAGVNAEQDIEAMQLIREAVGDRIRIRMDANQGWTVPEAIRVLNAMEPLRIEAVEQPLPYWNIEGHAYIRNKVMTPIMADESVHSPQDALKIVKQDAADILNIKLMKSAGLYKAAQINHIAEAAGLTCMVGCMLESKIGITAGASLVAAKKNILDADLDSFLYIKDTGIQGGISIHNGVMTLPEKPGLGIELEL
ncbi:mandelate racemase/muconate lactonizing enzyme family protein [Sporosarcina sp. Te-1]|uniref:mandelate racemase/muconate lactonizing enzyme family protein n=1 Tax=Sporosarcina sp. Te-1 TaxID=2818390 RepID=UPI001A9FBEA6|nr:dipeptide epimerase [Sporosarcina sp. Te-1]QTD42756.1 dipeptide epimerase [Sporosarcina sp. Te-1]